MRSLSSPASAAVLAATLLVPSLASAQKAPPPVAETPKAAPADTPCVDYRVLAVGAGAVMGIVAFNVLSAPLGAVPLAGGALEVVPYSVALGSRLLAAASASVGALAATWAYDTYYKTETDYRYLVALAAGAIAGVAAGNYLTIGSFGILPYYAGAGEEAAGGALASTGAQAASRVYVIGSGVLGAWAADYLYRH